MAGCRIVNEGVSSAVEAINGYATSYRTAGETEGEEMNMSM